jgi:superfamily I DNA/RNA helicase
LGSDLRTRLPADEDLVIGAFLQLARNFAGMPQLDVPVDAGDEWWSFTAIGHLHRHWPSITDRFDTIVVDEAQDFSPVWIAWLTALLNPQGRLLLVADEAQDLYHRGFAIPSADDGWTRCELVTNCRNTFEIAKLLRRFLNGAAAPKRRPESLPIGWIEATSVEEAVRAVKSELARLLEREERDPPGILVETVSSSLRPDFTRQSRVRETIREQLGLVAWESRGQGSVVCENVHRAKGLEWDTVLLVSETEDISDSLLYVGISRAVSELVIIGPRALARRLGLTT